MSYHRAPGLTHSALGALVRERLGTSSRVDSIQSAASSSRSNEGRDASELSKLAVRASEPFVGEGVDDGELSSPLRRRPTTSATSASACRRRARAKSAARSSLAAARRSNASRRASSVGALARTLACAMQRRSERETRRIGSRCARRNKAHHADRAAPGSCVQPTEYREHMLRRDGRRSANVCRMRHHSLAIAAASALRPFFIACRTPKSASTSSEPPSNCASQGARARVFDAQNRICRS